MRQTPMSTISAVIVLAWAPAASAQIWSTVAATGAVDESDTSMYVFGSTGAAAIRSSVTGTLHLRFPVRTVTDLLVPQEGDCPEMRAIVRDTGAGARVIVRLMRLGIGGEAIPGQLDFSRQIDSNTLPPGGDPNQYRSHRVCLDAGNDGLLIDYASFAYFVEAQLIKTTATASPGLMSLQICPSQDACDP